MKAIYHPNWDIPERFQLNIAVVGGGSGCKFFLENLRADSFPYLEVNVVGVCDINPNAEGLVMARNMGIFTTSDFRDLFKFENLDSIVEMTKKKEVLLEIIKLCPEHVGVMEHNIGRFFTALLKMSERLKDMEYQVDIEKMSSDFLIQHMDVATAVLNTDFTIVEVNEAYLSIVDKPKDNVIGHYCYEIYYGLSAPCSVSKPTLKCPMIETMRTGKTAQVIHEYPTTKDQETYCNIVTFPLKNQNEEIFRVIEVWRDITEEFSSRWEERTRKLKADLNRMIQEDRMISLGKLAASCAHEINNPIQGLLTFSDLIQKTLAEESLSTHDLEQFSYFVSLMSKELERCGNIVSGLLSFSRETQLEYKSLNINDILEAVITLTHHKMELQNIRLTTELAPGMIMVRGDANQLQQALLNLIFNAIEAMIEGGQLKISTKLDKEKKNIQIVIQDEGHGISKAHLDHIFDPFFTTKEEGQGTGLGLSIVYNVTKSHTGKISVESEVGKGTAFTLSFPVL